MQNDLTQDFEGDSEKIDFSALILMKWSEKLKF